MRRTHCLAALLLCAGCASRGLTPPDRHVYGDEQSFAAAPKSRAPLLANEILEMTFAHQLRQAFDTPRNVRKLIGKPYEALNVDNLDEVPNSAWFTNRNRSAPMTLEEIRRGPNRSEGPDITGSWTVMAIKDAGVTPGMTIVDRNGDRFVLKFDPIDFPELASGTEVVGTKLMYAAGYNVPENHIAYLDPSRLSVAQQGRLTVATNDTRPPVSERSLTEADLEQLIGRINPKGKRRVRVLASRFLHGKLIGPWRYMGTRGDDPNDAYPHEHRREIRGLYVIASWINHADMKEENTLDAYLPELGIVKHYLFDFGASMGSNSTAPSNPRRGQANTFDLKDSATRLLSLGLWVHDYERAPRVVHHPAVGFLGNELFRPDSWKPMYPVPAFENVTPRDAFWGTRIVTSFTDAQIGAAVAAGEYSDPVAADALTAFLIERRDRIGRHWFSRINALDDFIITTAQRLQFIDLAVSRQYADAAVTQYQYQVQDDRGHTLTSGRTGDSWIELDPAWLTRDHLVVSLRPSRPGSRFQPVRVYLQPDEEDWRILGINRP